MIHNHFASLKPRIKATLEKSDEGSPVIEKYLACAGLIREELEQNKRLLQQHPFDNSRQEILYYKKTVPEAYSELIFFTKLARLEGARKYRSPNIFRELLHEELRESEAFMHKHDEKCKYYYEDRTHLDDQLFTRQGRGVWSEDEIGLFIDEDFPVGAYWFSMIKANERWREGLSAALNETADAPAARQANRLPCMAKPVELVEIFKAMHLAGWFGDATFKEIMDWARDHLGVKIGNYDVILQELAMRKTSQTKALDRLTGEMGKWLDDKV
jgi:RteC protein